MAEPTNNPAENGEEEPPKPTDGENKFFLAVTKYTKSKADIDWDKVAEELNLKNPECAKVRFGQIRRKLGMNTMSNSSPATPKKNTAKPAARVKKTPSGRTGTKGKKGGKIKKEEEIEENFDDQETVKEEPMMNQSVFGSPVKDEFDAEAQLQADLDAMVNGDPF